jgi:hypothetical protein
MRSGIEINQIISETDLVPGVRAVGGVYEAGELSAGPNGPTETLRKVGTEVGTNSR